MSRERSAQSLPRSEKSSVASRSGSPRNWAPAIPMTNQPSSFSNMQTNNSNSSNTPFLELKEWRTRHMYRGWTLEPVELQHEPVAGSSPFAITRSNYGYRVLNSPDLGII